MWNDLDIYTKNNLMKIYNRHGISSLKDIQQHYDDFEQRQFAKGGYMNPYAYGGNMFLNGGDYNIEHSFSSNVSSPHYIEDFSYDPLAKVNSLIEQQEAMNNINNEDNYNIKDNLTSSNVFRNYNDDFSSPLAKVNRLIEQQQTMNNINNGDKSYETFTNNPFFDSTEINRRVQQGYNQPFKTVNNPNSYDSPYLYKSPEDLNNEGTTSVNNSTTTTSNPTTTDNTSRNNKVTTQSPSNNNQNKRNYKKTDEYLTNLYEYIITNGFDVYDNYSFDDVKNYVKKFNDSHPYYRDVMGNIRFNDIMKKEKQFFKKYRDNKKAYLKKNNVSKGDKFYDFHSSLFDAQHPYYGTMRRELKASEQGEMIKDLIKIKRERKKDEYKKALNAYISRMTKKPGNKKTEEQLRAYFDKSHPYYGDLRKYRG